MQIGFWGPLRLRKGMCHGIIPDPKLGQGADAYIRAQGRIAVQLEQAASKGLRHLIVSDENMLGLMRQNFSAQSLYAATGERIARFTGAYGGSVKAIHLSVRCPSEYWTSALSFCIPRGVLVPQAARLEALAQSRRSWRDVITDIAAAAPNTQIYVSTYEQHGSAPERLLSYLMGQSMPAQQTQIWRNKRPSAQELLRLPLGVTEIQRLKERISDTRWHPFSSAQKAKMQEQYTDDLFWLRAGADGLAHLLEDPKSEKTGSPAQMDFVNKGQSYDTRQRLARYR